MTVLPEWVGDLIARGLVGFVVLCVLIVILGGHPRRRHGYQPRPSTGPRPKPPTGGSHGVLSQKQKPD